MLESDSSIFIQIVDIFIGVIVYRYKHSKEIPQNKKKSVKMQFVEFLEQELKNLNFKSSGNYKHDKSLKGIFRLFKDNFYFSVYDK